MNLYCVNLAPNYLIQKENYQITKKYFHELVTCDDCGERLSGQQTLIYHRRNHQTFECETCNKLLDFYNAKRLKTKLQND